VQSDLVKILSAFFLFFVTHSILI